MWRPIPPQCGKRSRRIDCHPLTCIVSFAYRQVVRIKTPCLLSPADFYIRGYRRTRISVGLTMARSKHATIARDVVRLPPSTADKFPGSIFAHLCEFLKSDRFACCHRAFQYAERCRFGLRVLTSERFD